jgi:contractile injection system tube protein
MPHLEKAKLCRMTADANPTTDGDDIPVQFNPSSMHLVLQSATDASQTPARQVEQHLGSGNITLTLDLHFDSADEGTTDRPSNVRDKTAQVAQFMLPATGSSGPPPRVRFQWGDFVLIGVMGSYNEDIDLFSPQGVPLRAKVSISIRGQNPDFAANRTGPGAATGAGATAPGSFGGAPGTVGFGSGLSIGASAGLGGSVGIGAGVGGSLSLGVGATDRTGVAIGGESAAEFAARMGADPTAWRGIAAGLGSTVSIGAGTEIDFSSGLSTNVGVGNAVGVEAGSSVSTAAAVGLDGETAAPPRPGAAPGTTSGLALAAAGGVQAAISTVQIADTTSAATGALQAYALAPASPTAPPPPAPPAAGQPRQPLPPGPLPVAAARRRAQAAPPPPQVDPRAIAFGFGIPLRPLVTGAAVDARSGAIGGVVVIAPRAAAAATQAPTTVDPTAAPWRELPPADPGRAAADAAQKTLRPGSCGCGCGGAGDCGCGCGGGCR